MGKRKSRRPTAKSRGGPGGGGSEPPPVSETETEAEGESDFCFLCKDGGDLRLCDFRNCHKAYHAHCVGKGEDFLNSDDEFFCRWHTCFICKGRSYFRCLCCPSNSVCLGCRRQAEFVQVRKQTKGFCTNCLRMAIMIEKNIEVDSDGEKVDFSDKSTYEFLFKDYWEIVNEKEGLTLDNLQEANSFLDSPNCNHVSHSENFPKEHSSDDDFLDNVDDDNDNDEPIRLSNVNGASNKVKALRKQGKSKKNVYVGWASKELIEFLASIGKDTSVSLDQFGAAEVVKEYIRQKDLLQKDKKKNVICDDKLRPLFRKQKIKFTKIYSLLERHIAANATSEDETLTSSEDNSDLFRKKKTRTMTSESSTSKEISEKIRRCFASLVRDNIKLIYLRRSLVMDLLKQPETFENKVIGCFVRVMNDLKDYKNSRSTTKYQLGEVTGIRKSSEEYTIRNSSISTNMLLCISSCWSEVKISMLSDEDFEEDECEHLRLMVKKDNSERKTVAEFEGKARNVHRDIVSHWIDKELQRLEKLIEVANEKGWRYEMHEYIEKRRLLRTPSERQRLLEDVPRVIPDLEDNKDTELLIAASGTNGERAVCLESGSEDISKGTHGGRAVCLESCSEEISKGADEERTPCLKSCSKDKSKGTNEKAVCVKSCSEEKYEGVNGGAVCFKSWPEANPKATEAAANTPETSVQNQAIAVKSNAAGDTPRTYFQNQDRKDNAAGDRLGMHVQKQGTEANAAGIKAEVINIDDDAEDDAVHDEGSNISVAVSDADKSQDTRMVQHETKHTGGSWYYMDPQDDQQGPFPIELLRGWKEAGFFDDGFRVWRAGESSDSAILLTEALLLKR
ncbi:unnamed protein product [Alopecurus aequalis]